MFDATFDVRDPAADQLSRVLLEPPNLIGVPLHLPVETVHCCLDLVEDGVKVLGCRAQNNLRAVVKAAGERGSRLAYKFPRRSLQVW